MKKSARKKAKTGLRFNSGKPRTDLLCPEALIGLSKVLGYGAKKYADHNWQKGMNWSIVIGCLLRHTFDLMAGKDIDSDPKCKGCKTDFCKKHSGLPTVDLIMCNAMFLGNYYRNHQNFDDRFKRNKGKKK
jgi:hypothetical protein